ncbi:MAG: prolipoprotein diacylglyceryl transferase family protein [Bradymonadaceae bacterium]
MTALSVSPPRGVWVGVGILLALAEATRRSAKARHASRRLLAAAGLSGIAGLTVSRLATPWLLAVAGDRVMTSPPTPGAGHSSFAFLWAAGAVTTAAAKVTLDDRLFDVLVPAGLAGLAVARLGCLAGGCDFGRITSAPWGLHYPAGSPAWYAHLHSGAISAEARLSAPTHPLPLYLAGWTVLSVGAARWLSARRDRRPGAEELTAAALYASGRLALETFRAPASATVVAGGVSLSRLLAGASLVAIAAVWGTRAEGDGDRGPRLERSARE